MQISTTLQKVIFSLEKMPSNLMVMLQNEKTLKFSDKGKIYEYPTKPKEKCLPVKKSCR